jgi:hypothetical protein
MDVTDNGLEGQSSIPNRDIWNLFNSTPPPIQKSARGCTFRGKSGRRVKMTRNSIMFCGLE